MARVNCQVLPSPSDFFRSNQLWPPGAGLHEDGNSDRQAVGEMSELFLYIALDKWLARLLEEAGKCVPAAAAAARAAELPAMPSRRQAQISSGQSSTETDIHEVHPSALLQHLPGGLPAVKSVLLAKHRAGMMKRQVELIRSCCGHCGPKPPLEQGETAQAAPANLLDEVISACINCFEKWCTGFFMIFAVGSRVAR